MKTVNEIFKSITENYELIKVQVKALRDMQSMLDRELSKVYHEIETTNFNACDGYKYSKKLQSILQQRRYVKSQLAGFVNLQEHFPFQEYDNVRYHQKKNKCKQQIEYHTNYEGNDWYENFKISIDDIAI